MTTDGAYLPHVHGYVRIRHPRLLAILALLHLPIGWLIESGDASHHADCTPTQGVLTEDVTTTTETTYSFTVTTDV